jgi:hypothetical protein
MSHDTDRDRRHQPIAGPPEGGGYGEYEHPYPRPDGSSGTRPDTWDQLPPTPFRPQGRPRPQSQADGFANSERAGDGRDRSGPYAGRGPKGYRRSDERIRETVSEAMARDGELDASEIEVSVKDGEVTLEGSVPNRWSKRLAEDVVEAQPGVRDVHNRLRVDDRGPEGH